MRQETKRFLLLATGLLLVWGCAIRRHPVDTPLLTNSQQPDKELFDRATDFLEHARFTEARLTLQTLINAYPDSEYLAKAKLAIADSWYRQGSASDLLQAESEYRDFITFFPTLPEAAEAQMRVAMIHYRAMEKPDRDANHARRAEQEFQKLLLAYPNGPFAPLAEQRLREVQEVLAEGNFQVGRFYYLEGSDYSAQPRLKELVERYPNYSRADEALYLLAKSLERFGPQGSSADAVRYYSRIVRDYPLSGHVKEARERLAALNAPVPDPDPVAVARMTYEQAQAGEVGFWGRLMGGLRRHPDVAAAQGRVGTPTMTAQGAAQSGALPSSAQSGSPSSPAASTTPTIVMQPVPAPNVSGNSPAP